MSFPAEVVFRHEWGRAVAEVTGLTGDLGLAEDAVQEAFAVALSRWAGAPPPDDPSAWLITVAKHHALDRLRREARRTGKEEGDRGFWTGPRGCAAPVLISCRPPSPPAMPPLRTPAVPTGRR